MSDANGYKYLGPRQGSNYRQFFVNGTRTRAEVIYRETVGVDPRTPQEVADDHEISLEAVLEAIRYCEENDALLQQERDREEASIRAHGWDKPPHVPADWKP